MGGIIQSASDSDSGVMMLSARNGKLHVDVQAKPEPPKDFWEQLKADADRLRNPVEERPENAKTLAEIAENLGVSDGQARRLMRRMLKAGVYERLGKNGQKGYYRRISDDDTRTR